jgi:3-phenylpropionate/trans-cinnamate dioxygenase ferredoxin component
MADPFVLVARLGDLAPGQMKCVALDGERVLLANVGGRFYAVAETCGHKRAPLSRGRLDGAIVECPLHFARYDVRTGKLVDGPAAADVPCYQVRIDGDSIYVRR